MTSGSSAPEIRATLDPHIPGKVNIYLGTTYLSMTVQQFDELIKAVYIAVNIDKAVESATSA